MRPSAPASAHLPAGVAALRGGIAVAAMLMATVIMGQTPGGAELPGAPRYNVELIVFRHLDQSSNTEETWQPIVPEPVETEAGAIYGDAFDPAPPENAVEAVVAPAPGTAAAPLPATELLPAEEEDQPLPVERVDFFLLDLRHQAPQFVRLPESRFQLDKEYDRLELLDAYQPLIHLAWNQAAYGKSEALAFDIPESTAESSGVSGAVTVYKDRFLHLGLNLEMVEATPENTNMDFTDGWQAPISLLDEPFRTDEPSRQGTTFSLQESRRIRGDLLQYFDHPKFGVIVKIGLADTQRFDSPDQG